MVRFCLPVLLVTLLLPVFASEPGQPLDCSDWVFLEPGYSCSHWVAFPCDPAQAELCWLGGDTHKVFDNAGWQYFIRIRGNFVTGTPCGDLRRYELWRYDGVTEHLFAHITERCNGSARDGLQGRPGLGFDDKGGRLSIDFLTAYCEPLGGTCSYENGVWIGIINGFATTFDILQTFTPTVSQLGFRMPYMPEGFQEADWFDTYYGDLATMGDWGQAQPLQCEYPAGMPEVGDYLTVDDPLPAPPPGEGRYYVTATNYQGQIRYGRKAIGGVLSGRDPAVLPTCIP